VVLDVLRRAFQLFQLALSFLTVLPAKLGTREFTESDIAASRWYYPAVGGLIGLLLTGMNEIGMALNWYGPLASFLLLAVWVLVTGGLHLDGLADTADGLFLAGGAERRLAVMRDPHLGSFGVIAIILVLLGKYVTLAGVAGHARSVAVAGAAFVGRSLILVSAGSAGYARPDGTGKVLVEGTHRGDCVAAVILICVAGLLLSGWVGLSACLIALMICWSLTTVAARRVGGITGDVLGAVVELGELGYLFVLALRSNLLATAGAHA
jgi:adenosylcobinamide-GDP ribazoletransferase